jgi:hydrogenase maturation protease
MATSSSSEGHGWFTSRRRSFPARADDRALAHRLEEGGAGLAGHGVGDDVSASGGAVARDATPSGGAGTTAAARLRLLICGEPARGDDAAAFAAVTALPSAVRDRVDVVSCGQLQVDHLLDVPAGVPCIVLDAAVGVPPGEVVMLSLADVAARRGGSAPRTSHTLAPDQVIALAATLRGAPPAGVFIGIGGADFALGAELSPAVLAGLPRLVEVIAREVERLAPAPPPRQERPPA